MWFLRYIVKARRTKFDSERGAPVNAIAVVGWVLVTEAIVHAYVDRAGTISVDTSASTPCSRVPHLRA